MIRSGGKENRFMGKLEILAPVGGWESLEPAVRCGAVAV